MGKSGSSSSRSGGRSSSHSSSGSSRSSSSNHSSSSTKTETPKNTGHSSTHASQPASTNHSTVQPTSTNHSSSNTSSNNSSFGWLIPTAAAAWMIGRNSSTTHETIHKTTPVPINTARCDELLQKCRTTALDIYGNDELQIVSLDQCTKEYQKCIHR